MPLHLLPRALALSLPLLLLGVGLRSLGAQTPRPLSEAARKIDEALAAAPPGIVLVGNSKALTDFDPVAFSAALAYSRPVLNVQVHASSAPAWYAFLEQRVYAAGYEPEIIVVYGSLAGMLTTEVTGAWDRARLEDQLTVPSPVLDRKVFGGKESGVFARAKQRGTELRTAGLDTLRNAAVGAVLAAPSGAGWAADGATLAGPALESLFGQDAQLLPGAAARVLPVVEAAGGLTAAKGADANASLITDLVALAASRGARVIFVREPLPVATRHLDAVPPDRERDALRLVNHLGAGWLDLRNVSLPPDGFKDDLHLGTAGRAALTAALAEAFARANVLGGGSLPPARPPIAPTAVRRLGSSPALTVGAPVRVPGAACAWRVPAPALALISDDVLDQLGVGAASPLVLTVDGVALAPHATRVGFGDACSGGSTHRPTGLYASPSAATEAPSVSVGLAEALPLQSGEGSPVWWVYPGAQVVFEFDTPWDRGAFAATLRARVLGSGHARLKVNDRAAPAAPHGREWQARLAGFSPGSTWTVAVEADADAWVVIDQLTLGIDEPSDLVGSALTSVGLLASVPRTWITEAKTLWAGAPAPLEGQLRRVSLPGTAYFDDLATYRRLGRSCSPVLLQTGADGSPPVPTKRPSVAALAAGKPGYIHAENALVVGANVAAEGGWRATLDPRRRCGKGIWMFPGDRFAALPVPVRVARLPLGGDEIEITGAGFAPGGAGETEVGVTVWRRGKNRAVLATGATTFPNSGPPVTRILTLDPPLPPGAIVDVEFTRADDGAFLYLDAISVRESEGVK